MKTTYLIIAAVFMALAALATPIAIGCGLYDWVANDNEFKYALWYGFKMWVGMLAVGLGIGLPFYVMGK